jgi:putative flippase GtrA
MTQALPNGADVNPGARSKVTREWLGMAVVGVAAVIVDFGVFNLLLMAGASPAVANLAALIIATTVAFLANLRWTFAHREVTDGSRALIRFFVVNVVSAGAVQISVMLAAAVSDDIPWLNGVKLAATIVATVVRFALYRSWVYRSGSTR